VRLSILLRPHDAHSAKALTEFVVMQRDVRFWPKATCTAALHMSAFGAKADMMKRKYLLLQSQLGVKRTWLVAVRMSAF
jgi:hypothetical protein